MPAIKGISIELMKKEEVARDPFNAPIYKKTWETIENVIVSPDETFDVKNKLNLNGKKARYWLGIPKGDTHSWENTIVRFYGKEWHTVGVPLQGIEELMPLEWNKKVLVEFYG